MTDALSDELKEQMLTQIPLARFGQDTDIANTVAFLASDKAKYITGQTIHVNGGMYMYIFEQSSLTQWLTGHPMENCLT